jgi:hypothetical protein
MKDEGVKFEVLQKPMRPPELLDAVAALLSSSTTDAIGSVRD